jgi:ABC-type branched-subunit amino acid transport system substrate-binding protein/DNA-binding beta-propeller fold protein YncE
VTLAFTPGTMFAGYLVESLIGRGGMGVVYRATDLSLGRPVALKLIAPELAQDARFRDRFLREPRLAASLEHPNVVPIHEAGEQDGQLYLAMRYVEGGDLSAVLARERTLRPERALAVLAQIADALDTAHRRGLVHRDVKPANVLLDEDEHAYLTDFGVTKQLGGASTDTGRVVGTLDYLAPEQIRGEAVDGRTDCYALACVLYECLSGAPPFRRETEAEMLWAHMQEAPAPLHGYRALGPVLERGLAKERDDRYGSCAELIEDARRALGLAAAAPVRRTRVPFGLLRRRRAVLAAGLLMLAGTIAAAIVALPTDGGSRSPPVGNGVVAIDPVEGRVGSFAPAATAPSNIAVGERAVWVLNTEDDTVSRIDPETKRVVKTFHTDGHPSDLAAGAGALWVGHGGGRPPFVTDSISRIDPDSGAITRTVKLPDTSGGVLGAPSMGYPRIAVGAGAVWASNPDETVSRIDPKTGRIVATIDVGAPQRAIAAGEEGVWFLSWDSRSVTRIDPRTNRLAQTIPIGSSFLSGIAVGAGSVWATSEEGLLWRIEPGPRPITRTIDVGVGVAYVAFGEGAVWTANYVDGKVSRIDPHTNTVAASVSVGASQALAAGAGSAWVSVAAGTKDGVLPASTCSEVASGGSKPDVLIASDLPLQGPDGAGPRAMADAIRFVLKDHGFRAGEHAVGYQSCDDSTAQSGGTEQRKCAANANAYARAERLAAVIGPYHSRCARVEIPILNRAPGGPLALISPTNTHPNLTRGGRLALPPPLGTRGEPHVYYPTGTRNFLRVIARDDLQGVALAVLAKRLGLDGVYLFHDPGVGGNVSWTGPFRRVATRLGVRVAGSAAFDREAESYDALADKVARSGAEGVLIGGEVWYGGDRLLRALRARLGARAAIMAGDGFAAIPDVLELAGRAAQGLYVATSELPPDALDLTPAGEGFTRDFGAAAHGEFALHAAQATEVVLRAIARSDGTRESVLEELRATHVKNGILGDFRFDRYGDITPAKITILRVTGSTPLDLSLPSILEGAVVDRVVTVPTALAE